MAYVQRWEVNVFDDTGNEYQVKIYQDGYASTVSELDAFGDGIKLEYNTVSDVFSPIRGSELTCSVKNEDNFDFADFYNSDYGAFKAELVDVTDSNTVIWTGFSAAENYSEPFVDFPYPSNLTFTCGLGELKNVEFTDASLHNGQMHIIEILRWCLNGLNSLQIVDVFNVYASGQTTAATVSPLTQTFVDVGIFRKIDANTRKGFSSYDVLKDVLTSLGCFIVQRKNRWWIIRVKEQEADLYYRIFVPSIGAESATVVTTNGSIDPLVTVLDTSDELTFINSSAGMNFNDRVRKVVYKFDPQHDKSAGLLENGDFKFSWGLENETISGSTDFNLPLGWTSNITVDLELRSFHGVVTNTYLEKEVTEVQSNAGLITSTGIISDFKGGKIHLRMSGRGYDWSDALNKNTSDYAEYISDNIVVQSGDTLNVACEYYINRAQSLKVPIWVMLEEKTSSDEYSYSTENPTLTVAPSTAHYYVWDFGASDNFTGNQTANFNITFTGLAKLTFRMGFPHGATSPFPNGGRLMFKSLNVYYQYADGFGDNSAPKIRQELTKIIDNEHDSYEINAVIGQSINDSDVSALRDSSVVPLANWARRNGTTGVMISETVNFYDIITNELLELKADFNKKISATLHQNTAKIEPYSRVSIPVPVGAGTTTLEMVMLGYTWTPQRGTFDVSMVEIKEATVVLSSTRNHNGSGSTLPSTTVPYDEGSTTVLSVGETTVVTDSTPSEDYPQ